MLRMLLFVYLLFNVALASAEEDSWYKTAPGCVIDGANPQRTNVYHNISPIDITKPLVQKWKIKVSNPDSNIICFKNSIITADGALDTETGKQIWKSNIPIGAINIPYGTGQIYKDRQFVVGYLLEKGTVLYQADPVSGKILEADDIDKPDFHGSSLLLYNNVAYLLDFHGIVVAYDMKQHKVLWSYTTKTTKPYGEYLAIDQVHLAFMSDDSIIELDANTGKLVFRVKTFFGAGLAFTNGKLCEWGYNKIQCYKVEDGKKALDIYDETILPAQGVIYSEYAFFRDANDPNKTYEISFSHPPAKNEIKSLNSFAYSSVFGIEDYIYYYDFNNSKYCLYDAIKKEKCQKFNKDVAFILPTSDGLVGVDNYRNIYFFN